MLASVVLTVIFFFLTKLFQLEKTLKRNYELLHRKQHRTIKRGRNLFQRARKSLRRRHNKRKLLILALAFQGRQQMTPDRHVWVKCRPQGDVFWNVTYTITVILTGLSISGWVEILLCTWLMNSNQLYKSRLQTGESQLITDDDLTLWFGGLLHPVSTGLWLNCSALARRHCVNSFVKFAVEFND